MPPYRAEKGKFRYNAIPISSKRETPVQKKVLHLFSTLGKIPDQLCTKLLEIHVLYIYRAGDSAPEQDLMMQRFPNTEISTCEFANSAAQNLSDIYCADYTSSKCQVLVLNAIMKCIHDLFKQENLPHKLIEGDR
eukprot:UN18661